jgi:hypothetical protein
MTPPIGRVDLNGGASPELITFTDGAAIDPSERAIQLKVAQKQKQDGHVSPHTVQRWTEEQVFRTPIASGCAQQ